MNKYKFNLPESSITYLLICAGIILIFVLLNMTLFFRNADRNAQIVKLKQQIEMQKGLGPIYQTLIQAEGNKKNKIMLPYVNKIKLPRQEAGKFQEAFRQAAGKASIMTVSLTPDLTTLGNNSMFLLHNVVIKGEFADFRKLLIGLGNISYIEKIEEITMQQFTDSMEFKMKIWIALID